MGEKGTSSPAPIIFVWFGVSKEEMGYNPGERGRWWEGEWGLIRESEGEGEEGSEVDG